MGLTEPRITTTEAMTLIEGEGFGKRSRQTVITWCRKYGISIRIGGRWCINKGALKALLKEGTNGKVQEGAVRASHRKRKT